MRALSRILLRIVALIGGLVLVGWQLDVAPLKSVLPGRVAMNPLTALAFLLAAGSLWLLQFEIPRSGRQRRQRTGWLESPQAPSSPSVS